MIYVYTFQISFFITINHREQKKKQDGGTTIGKEKKRASFKDA